MPIDPSALMQAQPIQVPNPLAIVGQGAQIGNQLVDLQTKQAMLALSQNPELMSSLLSSLGGGTPGAPGGLGSAITSMSPEDLRRYGPAILPYMGQMVGLQKNAAEIQSFLAGAAEKRNTVVDTAIQNLSNNASNVLRNPGQENITSLLNNYQQVTQQMQASGFNPQLKLPALQGLDLPSMHAWLQSVALLNAKTEDQFKMANTPFDQWAKRAELSLRAQEMGKPELKQNELSGQLERVAPMPGGGVLPPGPPGAVPPTAPLGGGMPPPTAPIGQTPQQQLAAGLAKGPPAPGSVIGTTGEGIPYWQEPGATGAPPPPTATPAPAPPPGQFAPTAREKLNAPAMDATLKSVNEGALEATKMIPVLNAVEGMAQHMDAGGVWGREDSIKLLNMASAVPGLANFIDVPALSNALTFNAATAQLWAAMEKQLSSRGSVVALQASKSVKLATGDNPAATIQKIDYFRNAYENELELARAVNQRPNTFDLQGLQYNPKVWTPYKVVAPDGEVQYATSPQQALRWSDMIRQRQLQIQQQGSP